MEMGLAIAARIIHAHGGAIWCEDNPDGGATFHFTLPATTQSRGRKEIAFKLGRSEKAVKFHRANSMEKTKSGSLADLVRFAEKLKTQPSSD